jgi:hypothetical protein
LVVKPPINKLPLWEDTVALIMIPRVFLSLELMQPSILLKLLTTSISYSSSDRDKQLLAQTRVKQEFSELLLFNTFCDNSRLAARPSRSLMTRAIRIKCPKREAGVAKNARPANALLNHLGIVLHLDLLFVSRRLAWPMKKNTIMWIERWRF